MTLNELCTNTPQFGALSVPEGQVHIDWRLDDGRLHFQWTERGGPLVSEPTRSSFGKRLMSSLGQQLKGRVELRYKPTGFTYALDVPLEA